jgi:excisionase family DNA binding protein
MTSLLTTSTTTTTANRLLGKKEVAAALGVSPNTLDRMRARGDIAFLKVGKGIRFTGEAVVEYMERVTKAATK